MLFISFKIYRLFFPRFYTEAFRSQDYEEEKVIKEFIQIFSKKDYRRFYEQLNKLNYVEIELCKELKKIIVKYNTIIFIQCFYK